MFHELKCVPWSFSAIMDGSKRFEIRKDDRVGEFRPGDVLHLREFVHADNLPHHTEAHYTGNETFVRVLFKTDFEQKPGFVVLSISDPVQFCPGADLDPKENHERRNDQQSDRHQNQ